MDYKDMASYYSGYIVVAACFEDMIKAIGERNIVFRWLMRLFMGKYAWHEIIIGKRNLESLSGMDVGNTGYGLEECDYHKDPEYNRWAYNPDWTKRNMKNNSFL